MIDLLVPAPAVYFFIRDHDQILTRTGSARDAGIVWRSEGVVREKLLYGRVEKAALNLIVGERISYPGPRCILPGAEWIVNRLSDTAKRKIAVVHFGCRHGDQLHRHTSTLEKAPECGEKERPILSVVQLRDPDRPAECAIEPCVVPRDIVVLRLVEIGSLAQALPDVLSPERSMRLVLTGFGYDVDPSARHVPILSGKTVRGDLYFRHPFGRHLQDLVVVSKGGGPGLLSSHSIDGEADAARPLATNMVVLAADYGREIIQHPRRSSLLDRDAHHGRTLEDLTRERRLRSKEGRRPADINRFRGGAHFQCEVDTRRLCGPDHKAATNVSLKAARFERDLVGAWDQVGNKIVSLPARGRLRTESRLGVDDRYFHLRHR